MTWNLEATRYLRHLRFPALARAADNDAVAGTRPSTNSISSSSTIVLTVAALRLRAVDGPEPVSVLTDVPPLSDASTSITSPAVDTDSRLSGCAGRCRTDLAERAEDAEDRRRDERRCGMPPPPCVWRKAKPPEFISAGSGAGSPQPPPSPWATEE